MWKNRGNSQICLDMLQAYFAPDKLIGLILDRGRLT